MIHGKLYNKLLRWTSYTKRNGIIFRYLEGKVPDYTLPDFKECQDGTTIKTTEEWYEKRRPEILELFREYQYGFSPPPPKDLRYEVESEDHNALDDTAIRKQVRIFLSHPSKCGDEENPSILFLIYLPKKVPSAAPLFVGLNFYGNQTINEDPEIILTESYVRNNEDLRITNNKANDSSRGLRTYRWPVETLLENEIGLATAYYGDAFPDTRNGLKDGIAPHYFKLGQDKRKPNEWGAISTWAWALSRGMDYFELDPDIDEHRVAVIGHSRLGKTSLWTGAQDQRFAVVFANSSGTGGAAFSRRDFGQTVEHISTFRDYWFCENFQKFGKDVDNLPVDQHLLFGLIAPRPCYVGMANRDMWADALGMIRTIQKADEIYKFLGQPGLPHKQDPTLHEPISGTLGYHVREGSHNILEYDWRQYISFFKKVLGTGFKPTLVEK